MQEKLKHEFKPIYNTASNILILGTFPSVKSREQNFYYGHPQNRFWKVISSLFESKEPKTIDDKIKLLLDNNIAIWDVIQSCTITGSSDSSIKNVVPNNISKLLENTHISCIYGNGAKACELYNKYIYKETQRDIVRLPSTSPANAAFKIEQLIEAWSIIKQ